MGRGSEVDDDDSPGYTASEIARLPVIIGAGEVARLLRISPKAVVRYAGQGEIPFIKVGGRYRFIRDAILETLGLRYEDIVDEAARQERQRALIEEAQARARSGEDERTAEIRDLLSKVMDTLV